MHGSVLRIAKPIKLVRHNYVLNPDSIKTRKNKSGGQLNRYAKNPDSIETRKKKSDNKIKYWDDWRAAKLALNKE